MGDRLEVLSCSPAWSAAFVTERTRIAAVLQDLAIRIDHHGSTAAVQATP